MSSSHVDLHLKLTHLGQFNVGDNKLVYVSAEFFNIGFALTVFRPRTKNDCDSRHQFRHERSRGDGN